MTGVTKLVDQGIMLEGHLSQPDAHAAADAWLAAERPEVSAFDRAEWLLPRRGLVAQAWWEASAGIVGEDYEGAVPVTIVHVPTGDEVA